MSQGPYQNSGYWGSDEPLDNGNHFAAELSNYNPKHPQRKSKKTKLIIIFALLLLGLFIFQKYFFRISSVEIIGNDYRKDGDIMELAGVRYGDNLLFVKEAQVQQGVNQDRYLEYQGFYRIYPNQLYIHVYERVPIGLIHYMGVGYATDMDGMVLEQSDSIANQQGLVTVRGMDIKRCALGTVISVSSERQFLAFQAVMKELYSQSFADEIIECNISILDNIFLTTANGYVVRLGDQEDMRAKIRSLRGILHYLKQWEAPLGSIDVSYPVYPIFTQND